MYPIILKFWENFMKLKLFLAVFTIIGLAKNVYGMENKCAEKELAKREDAIYSVCFAKNSDSSACQQAQDALHQFVTHVYPVLSQGDLATIAKKKAGRVRGLWYHIEKSDPKSIASTVAAKDYEERELAKVKSYIKS
jgi:hypothetical protein